MKGTPKKDRKDIDKEMIKRKKEDKKKALNIRNKRKQKQHDTAM
jgi:hypothetical protein